jgi:hypothetical protein
LRNFVVAAVAALSLLSLPAVSAPEAAPQKAGAISVNGHLLQGVNYVRQGSRSFYPVMSLSTALGEPVQFDAGKNTVTLTTSHVSMLADLIVDGQPYLSEFHIQRLFSDARFGMDKDTAYFTNEHSLAGSQSGTGEAAGAVGPPSATDPAATLTSYVHLCHRFPPLPPDPMNFEAYNKMQAAQLRTLMSTMGPYQTAGFRAKLKENQRKMEEASKNPQAAAQGEAFMKSGLGEVLMRSGLIMYQALQTGEPQIIKKHIDGKTATVFFSIDTIDPIDKKTSKHLDFHAPLEKEDGVWKLSDSITM